LFIYIYIFFFLLYDGNNLSKYFTFEEESIKIGIVCDYNITFPNALIRIKYFYLKLFAYNVTEKTIILSVNVNYVHGNHFV